MSETDRSIHGHESFGAQGYKLTKPCVVSLWLTYIHVTTQRPS